MRVSKLLLLTILLFSFSACSAKKESILGETKLLLSIEERDFNADQVTVLNFFDNGLKQEIITHGKNKVFTSSHQMIKFKEKQSLKALVEKLEKLDYENSFPWKEGLYERGNVFKISFLKDKKLEYLTRKNSKDKESIRAEKILYYYQGHKESPALFKELIKFTKSL